MGVFGFISKRKNEMLTGSNSTANKKATVNNYDDIINDPHFQESLKPLQLFYRFTALAGGTDPLLVPQFEYGDKKHSIIVRKRGYDLNTRNLKDYYDSKNWEEAIQRFAVDLLGEYADEMKKVSITSVADHWIEVTNLDNGISDFILQIEWSVDILPHWNYPGDIRDLYIKECWKTKIY